MESSSQRAINFLINHFKLQQAAPEAVIDEVLKDEIVFRLKNYSNVNAYITAVEMDMMTKLVDKVVERELPEVINVTEAETELSVSNLIV